VSPAAAAPAPPKSRIHFFFFGKTAFNEGKPHIKNLTK
jgi:hypothetical protein